MYYVYILESEKDGKMYVGSTLNLKRRFDEHNAGKSPSTKNRRPLKLIFYEAYLLKVDGERRELYLKTAKVKQQLNLC